MNYVFKVRNTNILIRDDFYWSGHRVKFMPKKIKLLVLDMYLLPPISQISVSKFDNAGMNC